LSKKKPSAGVIAGGVLGGLIGLAALLCIALVAIRRYRRNKYQVTEMAGTSATNLDSHPVYEKSGSHVLATELPGSRDSKKNFGSESPAELYGDHALEMGVVTERWADNESEHASVHPPEAQAADK
jgi:hypothetical protein